MIAKLLDNVESSATYEKGSKAAAYEFCRQLQERMSESPTMDEALRIAESHIRDGELLQRLRRASKLSTPSRLAYWLPEFLGIIPPPAPKNTQEDLGYTHPHAIHVGTMLRRDYSHLKV